MEIAYILSVYGAIRKIRSFSVAIYFSMNFGMLKPRDSTVESQISTVYCDIVFSGKYGIYQKKLPVEQKKT